MRGGAIDAATEAGDRRGVGAPLGATVVEIVDAGQIHQHLELESRIIAQRARRLEEPCGVSIAIGPQ